MRVHRRRFVFVGLLATLIDVGVFVVLAEWFPDARLFANFAALGAAAFVSNLLHLVVTFPDSPYTRWLQRPWAFLTVALLAGAIDTVVLAALLSANTSMSAHVGAKVVAVLVAAVLRGVMYRWFLFRIVRSETSERRQRPPATGQYRLSVVVPAYGEAERIGDTVTRLRADLTPAVGDGGLELIVVDDGSTDATAEAARAAGADVVLVQEHNQGKGAAVKRGMLEASGATVAFTDADLSYAPDQIIPLLHEVEDGWDVVVGSRRHEMTSTLVKARRLREVGGRVINALTQIVLLGQYRDTQCGLKAFRGDVAKLVFSRARVKGFAFDVEVFHLIERFALSLREVPVTVVNSERSTVHVVRDAYRLVRDLFRVRLWARAGLYEVDNNGLDDPDVVALLMHP